MLVACTGVLTQTTEQPANTTYELFIGEQELLERAHQGDGAAQYRLGLLYVSDSQGMLTAHTGIQGGTWLLKAAQNGYVDAQVLLAQLYQINAISNESISDENGADFWLQKAYTILHQQAQQGDADAQFNLGIFYKQGISVEADINEAFDWIYKAAQQGHAQAQAELAEMYQLGDGVVVNEPLANEWFGKAVDSFRFNIASARATSYDLHHLSILYEEGLGVATDSQKAYVLTALAVRSGVSLLQGRQSELRRSLISEQVDMDELDRIVKQCMLVMTQVCY